MKSMKPLNKSLAILLLGGGAAGAFLGAGALHSQLSFGQNQATPQQLNQAEDLSTVFRDIGKKVEPSVVEIVVHKTVKGPKGIPLPDDMLRRFFPNEPGVPNLPNQPGGPDEG